MNRADSAIAESALFEFGTSRFLGTVTNNFFTDISQIRKYDPACNAKTMLAIGCDPSLNTLLQSEVLVIAMDRAVEKNT